MSDRLGDKLRLQHILDAIDAIHRFTHDVDYQSFISNEMMISACIRQLEIIGEAASKISDDIRLHDSGIEWRRIIAFRNLLIHEYFKVDEDLIWFTVQDKIPELRLQLDTLIAEKSIF